MAMLGTMRLAPTVSEIGTIEQICAVGSPARSSSLTIVAPQRVQVPHVEVRITAWTPTFTNSAAMFWPYRCARSTEVALPTVA